MRFLTLAIAAILLASCARAIAQDDPAAPATQPQIGKMPHLEIDAKNKKIRIECQPCTENMNVGLEFFCVAAGSNEYESVLRTAARPADVHFALLSLGMTPGSPVRYSDAAKRMIPPSGPPVQVTCEFEKDGKHYSIPAYRLMRNIETKKEAPPFTWIFAGSRVMEDGNYAADATGYVISVLNNELTVIDIPTLASRALETRMWERNADLLPPPGTTIWMTIEPAGKELAPANGGPVSADAAHHGPPATLVKLDAAGKIEVEDQPVTLDQLTDKIKQMKAAIDPMSVRLTIAPGADEATVQKVESAITAADVPVQKSIAGETSAAAATPGAVSSVTIDINKIDDLKARWKKAVAPHSAGLREAAQTHYEVINSLRREQQRLIDEADRIQRAIDELEKDYQDMTTPRPEPVGQ